MTNPKSPWLCAFGFAAMLLGDIATAGDKSVAVAGDPQALRTDEWTPRTRGEAAAAWTEDGLERVKVRGLDVVYAQPGTSLAGYRDVHLRPLDIAFRSHWERDTLQRRVRSEDTQRIRTGLSTILREEIVGTLAAGGYRMVDGPADGVLDLDVRIIDLSLVAPDVAAGGRDRVYAISAGTMTLVAELRDGASGQTLVRIYDHEEGDGNPRMHRIDDAENRREARRIANQWARALKSRLDEATKADAIPR